MKLVYALLLKLVVLQSQKMLLDGQQHLKFQYKNVPYQILQIHLITYFQKLYNMNRVLIRIDFPFEIDEKPLYKWRQYQNQCNDYNEYKLDQGYLQINNQNIYRIFLDLQGVNFNEQFNVQILLYFNKFLINEYYNDPISVYLVTSQYERAMIFGYNQILLQIRGQQIPSQQINLNFDLTSSSLKNQINHIFDAVFEINLQENKENIQYLEIFLENAKFLYSNIKNCQIMDSSYSQFSNQNDTKLIAIDQSSYQCQFNGFNQQSLILKLFNLNTLNNGQYLRLKTQIQNLNSPQNVSATLIAKTSYSSIIQFFKRFDNIYQTQFISFSQGYPKLFLSFDLDTTYNNFPLQGMFSYHFSNKNIILNNLKFIVKLEVQLDEIQQGYVLELSLQGISNDTLVPVSMIYYSFESFQNSYIEGQLDQGNSKIILKNIQKFNKNKEYILGLQIGFQGNEVLDYNSFGQIQIKDQNGQTIVQQTSLKDTNQNLTNIIQNQSLSIDEQITSIHLLNDYAEIGDFLQLGQDDQSIGGFLGQNLQFILKANIGPTRFNTLSNTQQNSVIEFLVNSKIQFNDHFQCEIRDENGVIVSDVIDSCIIKKINPGIQGKQYQVIRIKSKNNQLFWSQNNTQEKFWIVKGIKIDYNGTINIDFQHTPNYDIYINIYQDIGNTNINSDYLGIKPNFQFLDKILIHNSDGFQQLNIDFVNYFQSSTEELNGDTIPTMIKLSGNLAGSLVIQSQKLLLFLKHINYFYTDVKEETNIFGSNKHKIGCSISRRNEQINCYQRYGLQSIGDVNIKNIKNNIFFDYLEIHIPVSIISEANIKDFHILIPIQIKKPNNQQTTYEYSLALATQQNGSLKSSLIINEYKLQHYELKIPTNQANNIASIISSQTNINSKNLIKDKIVTIDTFNKPQIGTNFSTIINVDCDSDTNQECNLLNLTIPQIKQHYSFTVCSSENYFIDKDFQIINHQTEQNMNEFYKECVYGIQYISSDNYQKYCIWCPIWENGKIDNNRIIQNISIKNQQSQRWNQQTFAGLSGVTQLYGLFQIIDFSLINDFAFSYNLIDDITIQPSIWFSGYQGFDLQIGFTLQLSLLENSIIRLESNIDFLLQSYQNLNEFCTIIIDNLYYFKCQFVIQNKQINIKNLQQVQDGNCTILLQNMKILEQNQEIVQKFKLQVWSSQGTTSEFLLAESTENNLSIKYRQYQDNDLNKITLYNLQVTYPFVESLTDFSFELEFGNNKIIGNNEEIIIKFQNLAYKEDFYQSQCLILNQDNQLIQEVLYCDISDFNSMKIKFQENFSVKGFKVQIKNFYIKVPQENLYVSLVNSIDNSIIIQQLEQSVQLNFKTKNLLKNASISKVPNFIGIQPYYNIILETQELLIDTDSIIEITFPYMYGTSRRFYDCQDSEQQQLSCFFEENILNITGFYNQTKSIKVNFYGPVQLQIKTNGEKYFFKIKSKDNQIEQKMISYNNSTKIDNSVQQLNIKNIQYDNYFIREKTKIDIYLEDIQLSKTSEKVLMFFDYLDQQYFALSKILPLVVQNNNQSYDIQSSRNGHVLDFKLQLANLKDFQIEIKDFLNVDHEKCNSPLIVVQFYDANNNLIATTFQEGSTLSLDFIKNQDKIYLNYVTTQDQVLINKNSSGSLQVIREDNKKFNDIIKFQNLEFTINSKALCQGQQICEFQIDQKLQLQQGIYFYQLQIYTFFMDEKFLLPILQLKQTIYQQRLQIKDELIYYKEYGTVLYEIQLNYRFKNDIQYEVQIDQSYKGSMIYIEEKYKVLNFNKDQQRVLFRLSYNLHAQNEVHPGYIKVQMKSTESQQEFYFMIQDLNLDFSQNINFFDSNKDFYFTSPFPGTLFCTIQYKQNYQNISQQIIIDKIPYIDQKFIIKSITKQKVLITNNEFQKYFETDQDFIITYIFVSIFDLINMQTDIKIEVQPEDQQIQTEQTQQDQSTNQEILQNDKNIIVGIEDGSTQYIQQDLINNILGFEINGQIQIIENNQQNYSLYQNDLLIKQNQNRKILLKTVLYFQDELIENQQQDIVCFFVYFFGVKIEDIWLNNNIRCLDDFLYEKFKEKNNLSYIEKEEIQQDVSTQNDEINNTEQIQDQQQETQTQNQEQIDNTQQSSQQTLDQQNDQITQQQSDQQQLQQTTEVQNQDQVQTTNQAEADQQTTLEQNIEQQSNPQTIQNQDQLQETNQNTEQQNQLDTNQTEILKNDQNISEDNIQDKPKDMIQTKYEISFILNQQQQDKIQSIKRYYQDNIKIELQLLKDIPNLDYFMPLQEVQQSQIEIIQNFQVEIFNNRTGVTISNFQANQNLNYFYILYKEQQKQQQDINYQYLLNDTIYIKKDHQKYNTQEKALFYLTNLDQNTSYILYYFGYSEIYQMLPEYTSIYQLEFVIKKPIMFFNYCKLIYITNLIILLLNQLIYQNMENFFQKKQNNQNSSKSKLMKKEAVLNGSLKSQKEYDYKIDSITKEYEKDNFRAQNLQFESNKELMPFFIISDLFDLLKDIKGKSSTLTKRIYVQRFFEVVLHKFKSELIDVYNFCCLRTDVEWRQKDSGVGFEYLQNSVKIVTGMTTKMIREQYQKEGDLGVILECQKQGQNSITTFFTAKVKQSQKRITFKYIFEQIKELACITGLKTKNRKTDLIVNLLRSAKPNEGKYILRFLEGNFKIGAAQKLFQLSFSKALRSYYKQMKIDCFPKKADQEFDGEINIKAVGNFLNYIDQEYYQHLQVEDQEKIWDAFFQKVISQFPDVQTFFNNIFTYKQIPKILKHSSLHPSTPCKPMLAHATKSIQQVFKRLEDNAFTCEYKYDGLRGQIHYDKASKLLKIYSRNLEDLTLQYPDIASSVKKIEDAQEQDIPDSFILDSEIVAFDQKTNRILPFQILSTRSKKDVIAEEQKVKVCIFIFDILYINGKSLISKTFRERRKVLIDLVDKCYNGNEIQTVKFKDCQEVDEIQEFLDQSVKDCCEGLMVKPLDQNSTYEPAKRSFKWLKVKKDYIENDGIGDSLDLVVIGAKYGSGKRVGKFGAYLVACYDQDYDTYEGCCIVGTGFSDQNLQKFHDYFSEKIVDEKPENYLLEKGGYVDVWFEPTVVWEIKVADIQISPIYKCAQNFVSESGKGLGLRFPRFIRERDDKTINDSTGPQQIYDIYRNQAAVAYLDDDPDDYY